MDHDRRFVDARGQFARLPGGVQKMRFIAIARLQAERHAEFSRAPGDGLQRGPRVMPSSAARRATGFSALTMLSYSRLVGGDPVR